MQQSLRAGPVEGRGRGEDVPGGRRHQAWPVYVSGRFELTSMVCLPLSDSSRKVLLDLIQGASTERLQAAVLLLLLCLCTHRRMRPIQCASCAYCMCAVTRVQMHEAYCHSKTSTCCHCSVSTAGNPPPLLFAAGQFQVQEPVLPLQLPSLFIPQNRPNPSITSELSLELCPGIVPQFLLPTSISQLATPLEFSNKLRMHVLPIHTLVGRCLELTATDPSPLTLVHNHSGSLSAVTLRLMRTNLSISLHRSSTRSWNRSSLSLSANAPPSTEGQNGSERVPIEGSWCSCH